MIEDKATLRNKSEESLLNVVGPNVWEQFHDETQTDLVTSDVCFETLTGLGNVDYAACIIPLMKALENELINKFYLPYLEFLKNNYTVEEYRHINHIALDQRKKIISQITPKPSFIDPEIEYEDKILFTIKNFRFSISNGDISHRNYDKTVIEFYKKIVFSDNENVTEELIKNWLFTLLIDLESISRIRNDSAHAGYIQDRNDAKTSRNELIIVNKILASIASPNIISK